ncbi:MAG: hypothetical protein K0U23_05935 [Gammaproteobacteria bacterium]|nr:hypothetical protein [Gammaproteobacteria bacterium]
MIFLRAKDALLTGEVGCSLLHRDCKSWSEMVGREVKQCDREDKVKVHLLNIQQIKLLCSKAIMLHKSGRADAANSLIQVSIRTLCNLPFDMASDFIEEYPFLVVRMGENSDALMKRYVTTVLRNADHNSAVHARLFIVFLSYIDANYSKIKEREVNKSLLQPVIDHLANFRSKVEYKLFFILYTIRLAELYCFQENWKVVGDFLKTIERVIPFSKLTSRTGNTYSGVASSVAFLQMKLYQHKGKLETAKQFAEQGVKSFDQFNRDLSIREQMQLNECQATISFCPGFIPFASTSIDPAEEANTLFKNVVLALSSNVTIELPEGTELAFRALEKIYQADRKQVLPDPQIPFALAKVYFCFYAYHMTQQQGGSVDSDNLTKSMEYLSLSQCNDQQIEEYLRGLSRLLEVLTIEDAPSLKKNVAFLLEILTKDREIPDAPAEDDPIYKALFAVSGYLCSVEISLNDCVQFFNFNDKIQRLAELYLISCFFESADYMLLNGDAECATKILREIRDRIGLPLTSDLPDSAISPEAKSTFHVMAETLSQRIKRHKEMAKQLPVVMGELRSHPDVQIAFKNLHELFIESSPVNELELIFSEYCEFCRWASNLGENEAVRQSLEKMETFISGHRTISESLLYCLLSQCAEIRGTLGGDEAEQEAFEYIIKNLLGVNGLQPRHSHIMRELVEKLITATTSPAQIVLFYESMVGIFSQHEALTPHGDILLEQLRELSVECFENLYGNDFAGFVELCKFSKGLADEQQGVFCSREYFREQLLPNEYGFRVNGVFNKYFEPIGIKLSSNDEMFVDFNALVPERLQRQYEQFVAAVEKKQQKIAKKARADAERLAEQERLAKEARKKAAILAEQERLAEAARAEAEKLAEQNRIKAEEREKQLAIEKALQNKALADAKKQSKKCVKRWLRNFLKSSLPASHSAEVELISGKLLPAGIVAEVVNVLLSIKCGVSIVFKSAEFWDLEGEFEKCSDATLAKIKSNDINSLLSGAVQAIEEQKEEALRAAERERAQRRIAREKAERENAAKQEAKADTVDPQLHLDKLKSLIMIKTFAIDCEIVRDECTLRLSSLKSFQKLFEEAGDRLGENMPEELLQWQQPELEKSVLDKLTENAKKQFHTEVFRHVVSSLKLFVQGGAKDKKRAVGQEPAEETIVVSMKYFPFDRLETGPQFGQVKCDEIVFASVKNFRKSCEEKRDQLLRTAARRAQAAAKAAEKPKKVPSKKPTAANIEAERKARGEAERVAREEAERTAREQAEIARREKLRLKRKRQREAKKAKAEAARLAEQERLAAEMVEAEAARMAEQERLAAEMAEAEAARLAEQERLAAEMAEAAKLAEQERLAAEMAEAEPEVDSDPGVVIDDDPIVEPTRVRVYSQDSTYGSPKFTSVRPHPGGGAGSFFAELEQSDQGGPAAAAVAGGHTERSPNRSRFFSDPEDVAIVSANGTNPNATKFTVNLSGGGAF